MKKKILLLLATGFGLGLSPIASGTVGSLLGVIIVVILAPINIIWQIFLAIVLAIAAIPICDKAEKYFKTKDDGRIVADEYLTFLLCTLGLPWIDHPWLLAVAFLTNRFLDITKPPPARQIQKIHGGTGIVLDDVISSLYSLCINHIICWLVIYR